MDVYDKINTLLHEKGLSKSAMAKATGVSYNSIMAMFKRRSKGVSLETMKKFADYLDVSIDYLLREDISDINYGIARRESEPSVVNFKAHTSYTIPEGDIRINHSSPYYEVDIEGDEIEKTFGNTVTDDEFRKRILMSFVKREFGEYSYELLEIWDSLNKKNQRLSTELLMTLKHSEKYN